MAKKSFKGGLDNLLASAGLKKKEDQTVETVDTVKKETVKGDVSDDKKHWMLIKNENLEKELALWRTGRLSVSEFQESLKKHGLVYHSGTNEIVEK